MTISSYAIKRHTSEAIRSLPRGPPLSFPGQCLLFDTTEDAPNTSPKRRLNREDSVQSDVSEPDLSATWHAQPWVLALAVPHELSDDALLDFFGAGMAGVSDVVILRHVERACCSALFHTTDWDTAEQLVDLFQNQSFHPLHRERGTMLTLVDVRLGTSDPATAVCVPLSSIAAYSKLFAYIQRS